MPCDPRIHPECANYTNITRTLEPPQKQRLRYEAVAGCPFIACDIQDGQTVCDQQEVKATRECMQPKLALIDEQYPTVHYNETACVKEVLVRDLPVTG